MFLSDRMKKQVLANGLGLGLARSVWGSSSWLLWVGVAAFSYLVSSLWHVGQLCPQIFGFLAVLFVGLVCLGLGLKDGIRKGWCLHFVLFTLGMISFGLVVTMALMVHGMKTRSEKLLIHLLQENLAGNVTIHVEKSSGIVHIISNSDDPMDLFFVQGLVMAQMRTFQMEFQRRLAQGELSGLVGNQPMALEQDKLFRTLELHTFAEKTFNKMNESEKFVEELESLTRFSDGVNAYTQNPRYYIPPLELWLLALATGQFPPQQLRPWTPVDSLSWNNMMAYSLSGNLPRELHRYKLITNQGLSKERIDALFPEYDLREFPTIVQPEDVCDSNIVKEDMSCASDNELDAWLHARREKRPKETLLKREPPIHILRGSNLFGNLGASNNWVTANTASGFPILNNDPHLDLTAPCVWMVFSMENRKFNESAAGFSFVGLPGIVLGRNKHIAWAVTNVGADVQDLFELEMVSNNSYRHNGEEVQLVDREEFIPVAGFDTPVRFVVRNAPHYGPIITDNGIPNIILSLQDEVATFPAPLALRWTDLSKDRLDTTYPAFYRLNKAKTWQEFRDALKLYVVPGQNFIFASREEGIGYSMTGRVPRRKRGHTGLYPVPGNGTFDWGVNETKPFYDFDELPHVLNPKQGFIVTANNRVAPPCLGVSFSCEWDALDGYRAKRITQLLQANANATVQTMRSIQHDYYSLFAQDMHDNVIKRLCSQEQQGLTNEGKSFCEQLASWDFVTQVGSMETTLFHMFMAHLYTVTKKDTQEEFWEEMYTIRVLFKNAFDSRNSTDHLTTCAEQMTHEDCIRFALFGFNQVASVDKSTLKGWGKDGFHSARFASPLFGGTPFDSLFSRTVEHGGDHSTVNVGSYLLDQSFTQIDGSSFREIVTFEHPDHEGSLLVNGLGQNGSPFSSHFDSMLDSWAYGGYYNFSFNPFANGPTEKYEINHP